MSNSFGIPDLWNKLGSGTAVCIFFNLLKKLDFLEFSTVDERINKKKKLSMLTAMLVQLTLIKHNPIL